ncbi:flagellar hook capping FlgD N-terminal domain-containing protein [Massilia luteola]|jgi:flagellar basal-body rod modification protein FlgD|uniref:flagellar hook capping FlgD N-terminal domain-containing protein n=1 Tax=Massilia luteola TaxID=3081751 RepID=UPI002ACBFED6|nr:flagellar hook capping FlgD N-terminal domain-containing protein [Massilia sp. Gc5]
MTISAATAVGPSQTSQSSNIGIEDFLKILSAQLNNQDPLKPVDNTEFVAQIAQFASLEQSRELNSKIDSLLSSQASTQSIGLLGKTIDANFGGQLLTGRVSALSMTSGQPTLTVTTSSGAFQDGIGLSQIVNIR